MASSTLRTLGGFAFSADGTTAVRPDTQKARALMAYLVLNRGVDTSRDRLVDIFWPEAEPERARDNLKNALSLVRRCVRTAGFDPDQFVVATKATITWIADTVIDAQRLVQLVSEGSAQEALDLYRGDFLEGDYDDWTVRERERLAALFETALARVVRLSDDTEAAQRLVERNPFTPFSVSGIDSYDGSGHTTVTGMSASGGLPAGRFQFSGTYHVNPDCTGSSDYGRNAKFDFVVLKNGQEVNIIESDGTAIDAWTETRM